MFIYERESLRCEEIRQAKGDTCLPDRRSSEEIKEKMTKQNGREGIFIFIFIKKKDKNCEKRTYLQEIKKLRLSITTKT